MNFKDQLIAAYDADAQRRDENEQKRSAWKLSCRKKFADLAKAESKSSVLELGAGAGIDSAFFKSQGFNVLATDFSSKMVESCKQRGLEAKMLDLYDLRNIGRQFDAIYSLNVMLHVPKKDLEPVLQGISETLNPGGIFFFGVYGGIDKEEVFVDKTRMNLPRYFSFFSDQSLLKAVKPVFDVVSLEIVEIGQSMEGLKFQALLLRKK